MDEEGLYLLQKYSNSEVTFLGFVGNNENNKNFIVDTILNLSGSSGNYVKVLQFSSPQYTVNYKIMQF